MHKTDTIMEMDEQPTNGDDISYLVSELENQKIGGIDQPSGIEKADITYNTIPNETNIVVLKK